MIEARILLVEDEEIARSNYEYVLAKEGHDVTGVGDGQSALAALERSTFDLVVTDLRLPDMDGLDVLQKAKERLPEAEVLLITAYGTVPMAVEAMRLGAYHFLQKPIGLDELRVTVKKALEKVRLRQEVNLLREQIAASAGTALVGNSPLTRALRQAIAQFAAVDSNVLILGETGTGKELVAKLIHVQSPRRDKRFLAVNCAAFSEQLLESELFGHEAGAFTGARNMKPGLFEVAEGGTFFLDEIGDMPLPMQAKLLRVLEDRTLIRVGGTREIPVDVRIVAATNKDLKSEVEQGAFRRDLFYRLNVITLNIPTLAERREDIPVLAEFFVGKYARLMGKNVEGISDAAMGLLKGYSYPGNVRELENIVERSVAMCNGSLIQPAHLPDDVRGLGVRLTRATGDEPMTLLDNEKRHILAVLESVGWNRTRAAEVLGIDRASLWRKIKRYGLGSGSDS
ncbi:CheY-like receiver, AAA-type ATPase, and DNA-binding domain containing response regulator [Desulfocurvibacter africanus PCS]|uniref:CheY-like receiver, AAA-type ATPase, and DNA-binding domain containing response regulator n=1 Tax=Desulfocurvibacter africanus PCS TaxID=1262666 RepID=M5PQT6_DESAF|nr:sigma-54 dependent transcriptional regulator [Desulfocurvibacter africanus]EMG36727.1 CheY-like receiver, AAA-type ATPase, and DNA-binding domain containing response regulator [Desulfocurvibacter africanus PCS]